MQQHPIPHNVLDVEFKLVGKFTIKEFAYLATGMTIGGLFIYGFVSNPKAMPAWIAFPTFFIFAGISIFMITKIGNQTGDIFLRNFIRAITRPTRRVWQSKNLNKKVADVLQQRKQSYSSKQAHAVGFTPKQRQEQPALDNEEIQRLNQISQEANSINGTNVAQPIYINQENIHLFKANIQVAPNKLGSISFFITDKTGNALANANIIVINDNTVVYNGLSNRYGLATTGILKKGNYTVKVSHPNFKYPEFVITVADIKLPIIKIKPE